MNYLTATGLDIGLLINFGGEHLQIQAKVTVREDRIDRMNGMGTNKASRLTRVGRRAGWRSQPAGDGRAPRTRMGQPAPNHRRPLSSAAPALRHPAHSPGVAQQVLGILRILSIVW